MPFNRHLDDQFIDSLNSLYDQHDSWWRQVVDDPDVFIAARKNSINAYAGGGSIARIEWTGQTLRMLVHSKYLVFPDAGKGKKYCNLLVGEKPSPVLVGNVTEYVREFARIKAAAESLSGEERKAENLIAARSPWVIDIEAEFDTSADVQDPDSDPSLAQQGRMDLVVLDEAGVLSFVEIKLWSNKELLPHGDLPPAVCGQLIEYAQWLRGHKAEVLEAYRHATTAFARLNGRFFRQRQGPAPSAVDTVPGLLLVEFGRDDAKAVNRLQSTIVDSLRDAIPGFDRTRVKAVGGARKVQGRHLLLYPGAA